MTYMSVELYRNEILRRLSQADQEAAAWQALIAECRALGELTGAGGPWDAVNALLVAVIDQAEAHLARVEEIAASLLELLPQLPAIEP